VEAAADLLAKAKRPILIAGDAIAHGDARNEMVEVAELLGRARLHRVHPVHLLFPPSRTRCTRHRSRGSVAHPRGLLMQHDLLFSVGGDLSTLSQPSDVEPMPEGPRPGGDRGRSQGHAARRRRGVAPAALARGEEGRAGRTAALGAAMDKRRQAMRETAAAEAGRTPTSPLSLVAAIVDAMPEDAIVVDDSISSGHGVRELLSSSDPKSFLRDQRVDTGGHTDPTISSGVTIRRGQRERGLTSGETAGYADTST
jgi:benzoylformate decarboxylase